MFTRRSVVLLPLLLCQCGSSEEPVSKSSPEFSQVCNTHDECGDLLCVCGVCSARCVGDKDCAGLGSPAVCEASSCSAGTACRAVNFDSVSDPLNSSEMPEDDESPSSGGTSHVGGSPGEEETLSTGGTLSGVCQPGTLLVTLGTETDSAYVSSLTSAQEKNYGGQKKTDATAWTHQTIPHSVRSLLRFNIPELPENTVLTSLVLTLFPALHEATFVVKGGHGTLYAGSNSAQFLPLAEEWDEKTVTWNNQPAFSNEGALSLEASKSYDQVYRLDLTPWAEETLAGARENYGFLFKLDEELPYASLYFNSPDLDPSLGQRPQLEIEYQCSN